MLGLRRELTAQRDEIEEALRHSQAEFASIVGELFDAKMDNLEGLIMAAVRNNRVQAVRAFNLPSYSSLCTKAANDNLHFQH
jgi:hypothetical protein